MKYIFIEVTILCCKFLGTNEVHTKFFGDLISLSQSHGVLPKLCNATGVLLHQQVQYTVYQYLSLFSSSLEEEEEQEQTEEEEDESNLVFKSDHEFSPESDLENEDAEVQPTRRARTAQKGKQTSLLN
jgi:hypothetical protein